MKKLTYLENSLIYNFLNVNTKEFIELEKAYIWAKKKIIKNRNKNEKNRN